MRWTRQLGPIGNDWDVSIATSSLGNVYISGTTYASLDGTQNGRVFVAKYSIVPEPGTLLLATLASVALLLPRPRRQTPRTIIFH